MSASATRLGPRAIGAMIAVLLAFALAFAFVSTGVATAQTPDRGARADLVDLEDEVMCIVCGRPLATSGGDAAEDQRGVIQGFIDEGLTKDQVKDRLVAEYGQQVLVEGNSPVAALAPALAALVGGASIWLLLRRRLASSSRADDPELGTVSGDGKHDDAPTMPPPAAPTAEDDARIDAELSER